MPRAWCVCLTIVAAFPAPLFAAGPATVMAPVPAPVLALARSLSVEPARDRVRFLPDLVRLTHASPNDRTSPLEPWRRQEAARSGAIAPSPADASSPTVVVPLSAEVWSGAIFRRPITVEQLVAAILLDRRAALVATGLSFLDDETLTFLSDTPLLLSDLYERSAAAFAAFAPAVRVRGGRVQLPGPLGSTSDGDRLVWESVVGAPVDAPDRFLRQLFDPLTAGRLAYVYAMVADLDEARARFVLGPSSSSPALRIERMKALVMTATTQFSEWKVDQFPFSRPIHDTTLLLLRVRVDADGRPAPPAARTFWRDVWSASETSGAAVPAAAAAAPSDRAAPDVIDAAWLAAATGSGNMYERADRLDQLAFAQRVFGTTAESDRVDAQLALRAFPRQKMLMLTLERMGVRAPALFAFVSRRASQLTVGDSTRGFWVMAQLQPALALVARMAKVGSIDVRRAESLVRSLFAVPLDHDGRYAGGVGRWLNRDVVPLLPASTDVETSLLMALAGRSEGDRSVRVEWEGERYRIDFAAAELKRLQLVRGKQGGPSVDLAALLARVAAALASPSLDPDGAAAASRMLDEAVAANPSAFPAATAATPADVAAPGVVAPRRLRESIDRVTADLAQAVRARDVRRAAREAAPLDELVDIVLGEALLSVAYAADLGDPDSPVLLSRNAALRHDFGFGRLDGDARARVVWAVPRQDFQPGVAWHVTGAAVGLDVALARLSLTRLDADRLAGVPRVTSIERDGFAIGVTLMDRRALRDDTRDAIAGALARGTAQVAQLAPPAGSDPGTPAPATLARLETIADRLRLDGARRRLLRLSLSQLPAGLVEQFSLVELVSLGGGVTTDALAAWGGNALPLSGCPCTQIVAPFTWRLLTGRPQLSLASAAVPDLGIRVAAALAELRLPAVLGRVVLSSAIPDFLEAAAPIDGADWWALVRAAREISRERIEDYVAAAASVGGAMIPEDSGEP